MGQPIKGSADYFELGDYNATCSMCGRKAKASTMVRNWQGLYRHPWHNEIRQPQDYARGIKDVMSVPWAQPETDFFPLLCGYNESSAITGYAVAGCAIAGNPNYIPGL